MKKIAVICGERPALIRLMPLIRKLDQDEGFDHQFVWISQNFAPCLSTQFFEEFNRQPDINIENKDELVGLQYIGWAMRELDKVIKTIKPDIVLVLGDTNSSLVGVYTAKRHGIFVAHLEAGNRCYRPDITPEEINRYAIDSISDLHLCYTQRAREQLLLEGKRPEMIKVVGNPLVESIIQTKIKIKQPFIKKGYILATIHRKENIGHTGRLMHVLDNLNELPYKVKLSLHPSLKDKIKDVVIDRWPNIEFFEPCGHNDFLKKITEAAVVICDSGGVPEECFILKTPCVLLRHSTERPELEDNGAMEVCPNPEDLLYAVKRAISNNNPQEIPEYHSQVSSNVIKLLARWK